MKSSATASNHARKHEQNHALNEFFKSCSDFRKTNTFIEAMQFVARFTHYAPLNAFLIYTQRPTASFVATRSRWWVQFRRRLKERARAIIILAPMGPVAFVYDLEDTDGKEIPEYYAEPYKVQGELAQEKWDNALLQRWSRSFIQHRPVFKWFAAPVHAASLSFGSVAR